MVASDYSIKDLAGFSGIKQHTIRVWEQRYALLNPRRTETNIRRYSEADLKKILNVSLLIDHGYKISHVANMDKEEMNETLLELASNNPGESQVLNVLKLCTINFDEKLFYKAVNGYLESHGMHDLFAKIFIPFLQRVGLMWQASAICPAQEHFVSNLIRQRICGALDGIGAEEPTTDKTFVLFLPSGEMHELSLLMIQYLLRIKGHKSIYLGQSVPAEDLHEVMHKIEGLHFVSIFTATTSTTNKAKYLDRLAASFESERAHFHLSGRNLEGFSDRDESWMHIYRDTGAMIEELLKL